MPAIQPTAPMSRVQSEERVMAAIATLHGYHVFFIFPCETISIVEKCDRPYEKNMV
jgi:hypothetical protein